jgi:excinuclease ABC subunit A
VAEGPPEAVATVEDSFTGRYLAHMLNGRVAPAAPAADPKPRRGRKARQG